MIDYVARANAARQARVSGTTLFHVAVDYLNDATQWYRIAQLNGLLDPWIAGVTTLQLPGSLPSTAQGNGGILGNQTTTIVTTATPTLVQTPVSIPTVITVPGGTPPAVTPADIAAFLASLPTTLPTTPGVAWNNGGIISLS